MVERKIFYIRVLVQEVPLFPSVGLPIPLMFRNATAARKMIDPLAVMQQKCLHRFYAYQWTKISNLCGYATEISTTSLTQK
jgi:hypothetical protein